MIQPIITEQDCNWRLKWNRHSQPISKRAFNASSNYKTRAHWNGVQTRLRNITTLVTSFWMATAR